MKCLCRIKQFNLFFQVSSDGTNHNQWNFHSRSLIVSIIVWKALVFRVTELLTTNKATNGQGKQGQPRLRILARQERRHTLNEPKSIL